jgi:3-methyl-2-oxobutanoate hydroxymethyltransferase
MSVQEEIKRLTAPDIRARKGGEPIVCLFTLSHPSRLRAMQSGTAAMMRS